jgi:hypothetical protein
MSRRFAFLVAVLGLCFSSSFAMAQGTQVQLRLTNTMPQKADIYLSRPATAAPKFMTSLPPSMMVDVAAQPGDKWQFAVDRRKFQEYAVGPNLFQHLTLAPVGSQPPAILGASYQTAIAKPVAAAPTTLPQPTASAPDLLPPPDASASADGAVWMKSQFTSANNGVPAAQLIFGIPETDATQFVAFCDANGGGFITVTLVADVANFQSGQTTGVSITGNGFDATMPATVLRSDSGEGMEGFDLLLGPTDGLWSALLSGSGALTYASQNGQPRNLPLGGSSQPVREFLTDCNGFGSAAAAGGGQSTSGAPVVVAKPFQPSGQPSATSNSCQTMAGRKSENGGQQVTVDFVNQTNEMRGVDWIGFDGVPQNFGMLDPGQSMSIETWTSHPWMMTDGPGNCIEMVMPAANQPVIAITVPSPGFGAE